MIYDHVVMCNTTCGDLVHTESCLSKYQKHDYRPYISSKGYVHNMQFSTKNYYCFSFTILNVAIHK